MVLPPRIQHGPPNPARAKRARFLWGLRADEAAQRRMAKRIPQGRKGGFRRANELKAFRYQNLLTRRIARYTRLANELDVQMQSFQRNNNALMQALAVRKTNPFRKQTIALLVQRLSETNSQMISTYRDQRALGRLIRDHVRTARKGLFPEQKKERDHLLTTEQQWITFMGDSKKNITILRGNEKALQRISRDNR